MTSLADSVLAAVLELDLGLVDQAAADLALRYAEELDRGGDPARLGPALLAALEALHMTPRSRTAATRGVSPAPEAAVSPLDELRRRRRAARADDG